MKKTKGDRLTRNQIKKFRNALQKFLWAKFQYRFEKGEYDKAIECFLNAKGRDVCMIGIEVTLVPNDIILMRLLAGGGLDDQLLKSVKKLWDKERKGKK